MQTTETRYVRTTELMYLDLLKKCLTRTAFPGLGFIRPSRGTWKRGLFILAQAILAYRGMTISRLPTRTTADEPNFLSAGETMMGLPRLNNIQECVEDVLRRNVPGDLIETGVWRGGGVIFMRALLKVANANDRVVWAADSFQGVPKPNAERYERDAGDTHWKSDYLAVSLDDVKTNFERYGLLDDRVRFLQGWFRDTLPTAPIERLAVLRLDGDIYESTMDALQHLYPKLSRGGYVIVDDYGAIESCKAAVDDYRRDHNINDPMQLVEDRQQSCVYWRRDT